MLWHRGVQLIGAFVALQTIQVPAPPRGFGTQEADVVVDSARVLSPQAVARINQIAFDVHAKSGGEITLITLPDIGQRAAADVALQIGRQWGVGGAAAIGERSRNAGAVILLVPKETSSTGRGSCWVSTGRGVEGFITDADAGDICREATSFFRQRDYASGMELVALRVAEQFATEFGFTLDTALAPPATPRYRYDPEPRGGGRGLSPFALFAFFVILWIVLGSLRGGRRGRGGCGGCLPIFIPFPMGGGGGGYHRGGGGWGGGGFGGGGGGFGGFGGGGGFSGGGGGSNW